MIVKKYLSLKGLYEFTGHHLYWLAAWMSIVTGLYYSTNWQFIAIPWLPLTLIGTAVAFYVGFKNNQSYDRLWEARKIWGAMVNDSRKFATMLKNFRSDEPGAEPYDDLRKQVIYRNIAWLYQVREQLMEPAPWEHVGLGGLVGHFNRKRREKNIGYFRKELDELKERKYLSATEERQLQHASNKATQLLDLQTRDVQQLCQLNAINSFHQIALQEVINSFFDEQGRADRIKRFPFPRKYASFSFAFVCIFIFLLPFGLVGEFNKLGNEFTWLSIPVGVIVGWIYVAMEIVGDYSENPFEGLHNDIPMLSLIRNIEIDILQMIGEKDLPQPIQSKDGILL